MVDYTSFILKSTDHKTARKNKIADLIRSESDFFNPYPANNESE